MDNARHVFISYSRDDSRIMRRIKSTFREAGIQTWTDEGIEIGTPNWQLAIEKAIENCICMVCVLTPAAKKSHWVREELVYASLNEKPVFMIHTRGDSKEVAILGFTVAQIIDVKDSSLYQPRMNQLCDRIITELGGGDDVMAETIKPPGMTQRLPDPSELNLEETTVGADITEVKPFMPAAIPTAENHQLIVQRGKAYTAQSHYEISSTFVTIGREKNNSIYIDDSSVSRQHCQLIYTNEGFLLRDMKSSNGTYINADRVEIRNLKNNDIIQVGPNVSLVYRVMKAQQASKN